jgi:hypothetical protein
LYWELIIIALLTTGPVTVNREFPSYGVCEGVGRDVRAQYKGPLVTLCLPKVKTIQ